ncbi:MAG: holo-ACP synthase [Solirubrobacterales bacterium]
MTPGQAGPGSAAEEPAPGVGIDLLEIRRLERALERHPRLAGRVFTDRELAYSRSRARPGRHLAARFAAKEAAVKALGIGGALGLGLNEIEVEVGEPPSLRLSGRAAEVAREQGIELSVSLTHEREMAAAVAIAHPG